MTMADGTRPALRVPDDLVREILSRAQCDDVVRAFPGRFRTSTTRKAGRYFCPWCQDDRASEAKFATTPHGGRGWCCFKQQSPDCERGGDALALVAKLHGWNLKNAADYLEAVEWLAELVGHGIDDVRKVREARGEKKRDRPSPPAQTTRVVVADKPPPVLHVASLWDGCFARTRGSPVALGWLQGRGFPVDIHHLAESGFALLDRELADHVAGRIGAEWLAAHLGAALVAPIRSAATNTVEALDLRAFAPRDDGDKRRSVGALPSKFAPVVSDEDGAPRGYGFAGAATRAGLLVIVEGMADTLAAEAMLHGDGGAVVVGAHAAAQVEKWGQYLAAHKPVGRVVIVRHLDKLSSGKDGAGQNASREALTMLQAAGINVQAFKWGAFLGPRGTALREAANQRDGLDLAEVLGIASTLALPFAAVRDAFRGTIGAAPHNGHDDAQANGDGAPDGIDDSSTAEMVDDIWGNP